ncbi:hypothetical protein [Derxia lacustris]|uniref:hypothetical protein n=1 Tax=Derxia lacustris TaxID=764842 RepID=UPI001F352C03|nr:hypothetical protein [Derxia lacustris]
MTAAHIGMGFLRQSAISLLDLGRFQFAFGWQIQRFAMLLFVELPVLRLACKSAVVMAKEVAVFLIQPFLCGAALFIAFAAQFHLVFMPALARHDHAGGEMDSAGRFEFIEAEWADHVEWPVEPGNAALGAGFYPAERAHGQNAGRAIPDDPLLRLRRRRAVVHERSPGASQAGGRELAQGLAA